MNNSKNYVAGISAFVIWGFFSIPLRALKTFPVGDILYFRILFSALALILLLAAFRKKKLEEEWKKLVAMPRVEKMKLLSLTLGGAILLTINWLVFIYTVNHVNLKTATFSYLICPVITSILGFVLLKEKLIRLQWISIGLCTLSCVLMGYNSVSELGYSMLTAVTYAFYLITQRKNQGLDRLIGLCIQILFSFMVLNIFYNDLVSSTPVTPYFYLIIVIIAVVFTVLPLFLNVYALNKINSSSLGIMMYLNPIINFILAMLFFQEKVSILQVIGFLIILLALILFNYETLSKALKKSAPDA